MEKFPRNQNYSLCLKSALRCNLCFLQCSEKKIQRFFFTFFFEKMITKRVYEVHDNARERYSAAAQREKKPSTTNSPGRSSLHFNSTLNSRHRYKESFNENAS